MDRDLVAQLVDDFMEESLPHGNADGQHAVFRIGRLGPQAMDPNPFPSQSLALLPTEGEEDLGDLPVDGEEEGSPGMTGSYSSRLFGSSSNYFVDKILNKKM